MPFIEYRLGSNQAVYAPGIIRWAMNGYACKEDRAFFVKLISDCWKIPEHAAVALLSGTSVYTIEDEVVVFTA